MPDPKEFEGDLRKAIETHQRMERELAEVEEAVREAEEALKKSKEDAMSGAVRARIDGVAAEPSRQDDAEAALKSARYDAEVAKRAALAAQDRLEDEAKKPAHDAALARDEEKLAQAALAAVTALESLLQKVAEARGKRDWLRRPVRADSVVEPTVRHIAVLGTFRKPNGDSGDAADLTAAIKNALLGTPEPPAHQAYGLPVGAHLTGPFHDGPVPFINENVGTLSPSAASMFEELAQGWDKEKEKVGAAGDED